MPETTALRSEARVTIQYSLVACLGFVVDVTLLNLGVHLHLAPAVARLISLIVAMQVTFLVNGLFVFRCISRDCVHVMWGGYMVTNGIGNFCNYLIFNALVSLHAPVLSDRVVAVAIGGLAAWIINYVSARLVFGKLKTVKLDTPHPFEHSPATGRRPSWTARPNAGSPSNR
jgi:putative flippase GtrA